MPLLKELSMNKPIEIAIEDLDLGTPAALSESTVTVHIDGKAVDVPAGTSQQVLLALRSQNCALPTVSMLMALAAFASLKWRDVKGLQHPAQRPAKKVCL
jgi:hypothetical protein